MNPLIPPPDGCRLLTEGEIIEEGDLALHYGRLPWVKAHSVGANWTDDEYHPMCRKIDKESKP